MTITSSPEKYQAQAGGPETGPEGALPPLCRISHVLTVVPIGRSTVWLWARQGRFPKPFKFGAITVWKRDDIIAWLANLGGAS